MYSEFTKEFKIIEKTDEEKDKELVEEIKKIKKKLDGIYNNLRYADSDLIDYYYQIKAEESKYNYLIKQAKKKKITIFWEENLIKIMLKKCKKTTPKRQKKPACG